MVSLWVALNDVSDTAREFFAHIPQARDGQETNNELAVEDNELAVEELKKRALVVQEDKLVRLSASLRDFGCKGAKYCDVGCKESDLAA